jgi:transketolase
VQASVLNVPVIKPLDTATVYDAIRGVRTVVTAENHTVVGGLGSAVAEAMAEAGIRATLRRVGIRDTFAEGARTTPWLFKAYGLTAQHIVDAVWEGLGEAGPAPVAETIPTAEGEYAPV